MYKVTGLIFVFALFLTLSSFAQTTTYNPLEVKKIEVTGSAEMEVIPDEIYYSISLKEYKENNKKTEIEDLEKQLVKAVSDAGIPKENFQIQNVSGYRNFWEQRRKGTDFLASKQYVLKLENLNKINEIFSKVDPKGIEWMNISRYSHSKIEQYRKEIKIKALQAAKDKANYLVGSINEQLGEVLQIQEIDDNYNQPMYRMEANVMMDSAQGGSPEIDFQKITIKYQVRASFRIK